MLRSVEPDESDTPAVRRELDLVLSSPGFTRNERQSHFLRFLVERQLEGRGAELKESVIAVEVFGREAGYDPKLDGIVRTEAMRLRSRLAKFYSAEGSTRPLVIELPKGGYRPLFRPRVIPEPIPAPPRTGGSRRWLVGALAAAAVLMAAVWWWARPGPASITVAVLPFENQGDGPANDYFADGLTDEIIRNLSLIEGLTVPSRTSSFALKGKSLNASEAARQLAADYLVEGSVQHAGTDLRVTVALVRVGDGARMWSERFDRKLTDVFAIQDDISRGVVNTLRLRLRPGRRQYETNLEAYDLYLRGRHTMASFPTRDRPIAIPAVQYFEQAIAKDTNYAIAYAGLADALLLVDQNIGNAEAYARARTAAERAVELDPMLSEAQSALAAIRARQYSWRDAERGFRRATELNPNNALAHLHLGVSVLVVEERFDEALAEVRRAAALDPFSPYVSTEYGRVLLLAGRHGEAVDQLRKAIALDPTRTRPYNLLGRALLLQGKTAEALTVFGDTVKRGVPVHAIEWIGCAEMKAGRDKAAILLQQRIDTIRTSRRRAAVYACLGDEERALESLEKAAHEDEAGLAEVLQAPELAWMRASPRFAALRKKVNLGS